jgi:hypothetical protein
MPHAIEPSPLFDRATRHGFCHLGRCVVLDGTGRQLAGHLGMEHIRWFEHGAAVFERGTNKGVINSAGRVVMEGHYDSVEVHGNGLIEAEVLLRGPPEAFRRIDFFNARGRLVRRFAEKAQGDLLRSRPWAGLPAVEFCDKEEQRCTTSFLDAKGNSGPVFSEFSADDDGEIAIASRNGVHFGLVDRSLAEIGRQDHDQMTFNRSGFVLATQGGSSTVLDPHGFQLVPMGQYRRLKLGPGEHLLSAVTEDGECQVFMRVGQRFPIPETHCLGNDERAESVGYVIIGSPTGQYIADLDGAPRSAEYSAGLRPLNRRMISYQAPEETGLRFMMLEDGSISSSQYRALAPFLTGTGLNDNLLLAEADEGWGVTDASGAWLIPPRYRRIEPLGSNLVAAFERSRHHILDLRGKVLADSTAFGPSALRLADGTTVYALSLHGRWGLLDEQGSWRLAPRFDHVSVAHGVVIVLERGSAGERVANFLDPDTGRMRFERGFASILSRYDGLFEALSTSQVLHLIKPDGSILASSSPSASP